MKKIVFNLILNLNISVYLKGDNIHGYSKGTKCKLNDFTGTNYSVIIDGKWYGYYSIDCFSLFK